MTDHYQTLDIPYTAGPDAIQKAFRAAAKQNHPDLHPGDKDAEERFKAANAANEVLSDPARKAEYDRTLEAGPVFKALISGLTERFQRALEQLADQPASYADPLQITDTILCEDYAAAWSRLIMLQQRAGQFQLFRGRVRRRDGGSPADDFERRLLDMSAKAQAEIEELQRRIADLVRMREILARYAWSPQRPRTLSPLSASFLGGG